MSIFEKVIDALNRAGACFVAARVASIPHLIEMKERAGRPDDLSDITALRAILQKS